METAEAMLQRAYGLPVPAWMRSAKGDRPQPHGFPTEPGFDGPAYRARTTIFRRIGLVARWEVRAVIVISQRPDITLRPFTRARIRTLLRPASPPVAPARIT